MSGAIEKTQILAEYELPWNKTVSVQEITYEGGMSMLRLRIREGRRFTDLELMPENAMALAKDLDNWATRQK
ncbi:MAG TPA: hypothetical protein ENJ57_05550 [Rhizobiales bacterium]|nr:hypothetical protein [Hyphomicrobiales bacterium]